MFRFCSGGKTPLVFSGQLAICIALSSAYPAVASPTEGPKVFSDLPSLFTQEISYSSNESGETLQLPSAANSNLDQSSIGEEALNRRQNETLLSVVQQLYPHAFVAKNASCENTSTLGTTNLTRGQDLPDEQDLAGVHNLSGRPNLTGPQEFHNIAAFYLYESDLDGVVKIAISDEPSPKATSQLISEDEMTGNNPIESAEIAISTGLLQRINEPSELAFVIAHEMAHIRLHFFPPQLPPALFTAEQLEHIAEVHQGWEFRADSEALAELRQHGFSERGATSILERLAAFEPDRAQSASLTNHPKMERRLAALRTPL